MSGYRTTEYKGFYYRFNHYKNCYEVGKYVAGKWEIMWTGDTEREVRNDIDEEIDRRKDNESDGSIK